MKFEVAVQSDLPDLCTLLSILFTQESEFKPDLIAQEQGLSELLSDAEKGHILVARSKDKILGMVCLLYTISTALGTRVALLEDMIVAPQGRGKNIGSELIEFALEFASAQGCARITLLTDQDNVGAQRFYEKHGFVASTMIPFRKSLNPV